MPACGGRSWSVATSCNWTAAPQSRAGASKRGIPVGLLTIVVAATTVSSHEGLGGGHRDAECG